jgi:hypothetical protein
MQQVVTKAKADGNDWEEWADSASNSNDSTSSSVEFFSKKYLLPYIVYEKFNTDGSTANIYLNDGTYFYIYKGTCIDFIFDVNGKKKPNVYGRDKFKFFYCPYSSDSNWKPSGTIITYEPSIINTREKAVTYCKTEAGTCSRLLSFDSWEFKSDYPYKI